MPCIIHMMWISPYPLSAAVQQTLLAAQELSLGMHASAIDAAAQRATLGVFELAPQLSAASSNLRSVIVVTRKSLNRQRIVAAPADRHCRT